MEKKSTKPITNPCPFSYRVDIDWQVSGYDGFELIENASILSGYYIKGENPLRSRFLAFSKAEALKNNNLIYRDGINAIQVNLVVEDEWKQLLLYDSRCANPEIEDALLVEFILLNNYGFQEEDFGAVEEDDDNEGNPFHYIRRDCYACELEHGFTKPLSKYEIFNDDSTDTFGSAILNHGIQLELEGVNRIYKTHNLDLFHLSARQTEEAQYS